ncbi:MAG: hypothetical protein JKX97_01275, partial [Candidatus Lindowbacteria bacterium]|nr:hypothetical protein [Candidatus Lindowbacteria bacterium]
MKRLGFSFVVGLCCVLLFSSASWAVTPAPKEVPKFLNFQGLLTDSSGARVTGTQNVTFKIYDVASGGSALYSENHATLSLDNGIASVVIGSVTALTLNFDTHYWIGVTVSPDAEMTPRIPVLTVGYAMTAQNLAESAAAYGSLLVTDTVTATAFVGDGSQLTGITAGSDTDWTIAATTLSVLSKNVGIGIDTPGYALQVKGAAHVSDSFRIGTDSFIVTPGGLVGIGTATPSTTLGGPTVHLNGSAPELRLGNNSWVASGNTISLYNYNTALTTLFVNPQGKFGIGTTTPGDSLHVVGTGRFATQGDSIYITDSGIGIGEINPNVVNGTFSQILHIKSASNPGIVLENTGGGKTYLHTHADGSFSIMNDNNGDEPFHILNDGNVGINTIVPADTFEVVGTVHFSDTLVVDSTITAAIFYGSGAGLTGVAASSLSPANLTTAITADSIATGAVTTSEILDATIGSLDMATDAILSS